jgi:hypothetical protein
MFIVLFVCIAVKHLFSYLLSTNLHTHLGVVENHFCQLYHSVAQISNFDKICNKITGV